MTIRRALASDLAEVLALERETATAPHWGLAEYEALLRGAEARGLRRALFVAVDGLEVQGFAVGKVLGVARDAEAELESIVVRTGERRRGLGSALCRAVMQWSRAEHARVILLEVRAGSMGAEQLYRGLGFVAVGRRSAYYSGPTEDAIVMRCELGTAGQNVENFDSV